jgi:hypothetical protein
MKSFFEFLGFASTALISGFLVFTYVGHKKNADKSATKEEMVSAYNTEETASLPELQQVSGSGIAKGKKKTSKGIAADLPAERKPTLAVESASVSEKLKGLYADEDFVVTTAKKWKKAVADASETHSVKPHLLLSNVVVKSYLGNYTVRDFNRDVSEHAGDLVVPNSAALKSYDYSWSVGKVSQQYNLAKYFPAATPVAVAKAPSFSASSAPKKTVAAAPQKAKPAASVSPAEAGFREMVAKEEGFSSWQGLQRLGDLDTKKNADRRVKTLMGAVRVR